MSEKYLPYLMDEDDYEDDFDDYDCTHCGGEGTQENDDRERVWFSPSCAKQPAQVGLFDTPTRDAYQAVTQDSE